MPQDDPYAQIAKKDDDPYATLASGKNVADEMRVNLARNSQPTEFERQNSGFGRQFAHRLADYLPAAGGVTGGALGSGWLSVPAAALGGAAGESLKQLVNRGLGFDAPQTSTDAAKNIGVEGAKQGAYELGGRVVGKVGRAVAPRLAKSALGRSFTLNRIEEKSGADVGRGILDETTGITPATVAKQASERLDTLAQQQRAAASRVSVPLGPARAEASNIIGEARGMNQPPLISDAEKLRDSLHYELNANGKPMTAPVYGTRQVGFAPPQQVQIGTAPVTIPATVTGDRALSLRHGLGEIRGNWLSPSDFTDAATERIYGKINEPLYAASPETKAIAGRMANLIPVKRYATDAASRAGVLENLLSPKGSSTTLATGALGAAIGGPGGAALGASAGKVVPELLTRPSIRLGIARAANSSSLPYVIGNLPRLGEAVKKNANDEDNQ